jgi:hypothetical protein
MLEGELCPCVAAVDRLPLQSWFPVRGRRSYGRASRQRLRQDTVNRSFVWPDLVKGKRR